MCAQMRFLSESVIGFVELEEIELGTFKDMIDVDE
jgi:hypothetical protein